MNVSENDVPTAESALLMPSHTPVKNSLALEKSVVIASQAVVKKPTIASQAALAADHSLHNHQ